MKKKVLVLSLVLALFMTVSASAYTAAIGGEFALKIGNGLPNSALLSFRLPKFPAVFGLGVSISNSGSGQSSFVLLADWWLAQGHLVSFLDYYVGPGLFVAISDGATLGIRVPVGINAFPIKPLELFLELAPAFYLVGPSGSITIPSFGIQAGFGFRFWF
jgi:hypothetical protein